MGEWMARVYDPLIGPLDPMGVRKWRKWVVSAAHGDVLELGVGTGLNLPYYPAVQSLAAIDPDRASLRRARPRAGAKGTVTRLLQATAEDLPFGNESFDAVLGTLVFCTIAEPARALRETRRVLKEGGTVRMVEHVRVDNRWFSGVQDRLTPAWMRVAGGCHLNRDTLALVEQAGFQVRAVHRLFRGLVIGIDAVK